MKKIRHIFFILFCLCLLICSAADMIPTANAASEMKASDSCIEFIKTFEGFSAKPYYDYGQYTVGYGTKCPDDKFAQYNANGISKQDAEALLRAELKSVENVLNVKLIDKHSLTLSQQQFDALVSFSYNIGTSWIVSNSTLKDAILRNADANELVYSFGLYCTAGGKYLPGLVTRRLCEANIYLNGIYSKNMSDAYGYVYYDANGGSVTYRVQAFICASNTAPAEDAVKSADTFQGWYTDLAGGSQVTTLNRALTGKTLFARWNSSENSQNQNSSSTTVKITGDVVNIRSGPGTSYGIVKQLRQNAVVTVSHVTHLTNMKWGKVQDGWICLDYTNYDDVINGADNWETDSTPSGSVTTPDNSAGWNDGWDTDSDASQNDQNAVSGTVNVTGYLRIRSGPGTNYSEVGSLTKGTKVTVLEQKKVGLISWGRIDRGWVCMDYIVTGSTSSGGATNSGSQQESSSNNSGNAQSTSITGKITADLLRIRSGAGTNNAIVGFYHQNDTVQITEKILVGSVYWGKTNKGWISMDYVSTASSNNSSQPNQSEMKTVTGDCLRIRKEPGTNQRIVGFLYAGDKVAVLETTDFSGMLWGRIDKGWICMDYVR